MMFGSVTSPAAFGCGEIGDVPTAQCRRNSFAPENLNPRPSPAFRTASRIVPTPAKTRNLLPAAIQGRSGLPCRNQRRTRPQSRNARLKSLYPDIHYGRYSGGKAKGLILGRTEHALSLVSRRFGGDIATEASPRLSGMSEPTVLDEVDGLLLNCLSGNRFPGGLKDIAKGDGDAS